MRRLRTCSPCTPRASAPSWALMRTMYGWSPCIGAAGLGRTTSAACGRRTCTRTTRAFFSR
jgi:hypothetical protein